MPVDPSFSLGGLGSEWQIGGLESTPEASEASGFGEMLGNSLSSLTATQTEAAEASQALASGQASDPTAVVMAVERAQLAMQLASQIRTKAVEAAQTIFQTQV
ncbi:MAG TPA: flagellar hook-basal body complex protein FliE [Solirubrobacter sp.]|jgi:flagellar hook-basal body complex protein FliE|nr:flagellar hook-basal body complex protein FliE [Solirubrobacter sp.]